MQQNGFALDKQLLEEIVRTNNEQRFAFNEDQTQIRANQGQSISVELAYKIMEPPDILYHGTAEQFLESIQRTGIEKRGRHHVHLSQDRNTAENVG